jgi:hypothetical protein
MSKLLKEVNARLVSTSATDGDETAKMIAAVFAKKGLKIKTRVAGAVIHCTGLFGRQDFGFRIKLDGVPGKGATDVVIEMHDVPSLKLPDSYESDIPKADDSKAMAGRLAKTLTAIEDYKSALNKRIDVYADFVTKLSAGVADVAALVKKHKASGAKTDALPGAKKSGGRK